MSSVPNVGQEDDGYVIQPIDRGVKPILDELFQNSLNPESEIFQRRSLKMFINVCPFSAQHYHHLQRKTSPSSRDAFSFLQDLLCDGDGAPPVFCKKKSCTSAMHWMSMYNHAKDRAGCWMDSDDDHDWDGLEIGHDALLTYMQNILRRNTLSDSHIRMAKAPRVAAITVSLMSQQNCGMHLNVDITNQICAAGFVLLRMVNY